MKIERNPINSKQDILKSLNLCFPNWGGNLQYEWYFEREISMHSPDLIIFRNDDNEMIAGSAISYRQIRWRDGKIYQIGIMTGSWTLPAARGMGCFTKMIEISKEICKEKQVEFLTAFVTENNASYRRLLKAGSFCVPANNYFFEIPNNSSDAKVRKLTWSELKFENKELGDTLYKQIGFNYDLEAFSKQIIERIFPVHCYEYKNEFYIVEESHILKLVFVSRIHKVNLKEMMTWLVSHYQKVLMYFNSNESLFDDLNKFLTVKTGFFTMLYTQDSSEFPFNISNGQSFNIQLGDKV